MSFLSSRTPLLRSVRIAPARAFHASVCRPVMSESDHHQHAEKRRAEIEKHKHDSLDKQKDGKGHWKGELASSSEQVVKADRGETNASEDNIKKLQKETAELGKNSR
ncbi:MAG: hypothetical protein LQ340_007515 [Diploschistes diacapsis]|nr:MAG: hypothetical protein LQ340_007515 [Diploschistes diacapsis]